jgi:predicted small metal-binding protein
MAAREHMHATSNPAQAQRRALISVLNLPRRTTMKEFWCGAVVPNCSKRFRASSENEILSQVAEHARKDHGMNDVPAEVVAKVRAAIKDVE